MTQRSELQHRVLEIKAVAQAWIANKLFSFEQTGLAGFLKRSML